MNPPGPRRGPSTGGIRRRRRIGTVTVVAVLSALLLGPVSASARASHASVAPRTVAVGGYRMAGADGGIFSFGDATFYGSMVGSPLNRPIVGMAPTLSGKGYWLVAADGGMFSFGDAAFHGSMGGTTLNKPIVGMAPTPSGNGYWLVAADGGIFAFGDAPFYGSMGGTSLNKPIVGIVPTLSGNGYWLVAADGGTFSFGDALFYGSMGGTLLNKPIVGMAATPDGHGYWLVAADGGIFAFGDAPFYGSMGAQALNKPIVGLTPTASGNGYWMVAADGGVFTFGDAPFHGSMAGAPLNAPIVGMVPTSAPPPDAAMTGCDVLMTAPAGHSCLLPWPNDAFTVASRKTSTGRLLNVSSSLDPTNTSGVHVDTTYQNQGDGFSPGSAIMTYVPNLDLSKSNIATSTNIGLSLDPNAPIVIIDTVTGAPVPYFAELDAQTTNTAEQLLLIHPAGALTEGHRYAVALRNLIDTSGKPIGPLPSTTAALAGTLQPSTRGAHIKWVIQNELAPVLGSTVPYQAWDFTVADAQSLAGPALTMHNLAYQWLGSNHQPMSEQSHDSAGDYAPSFTVTSQTTIAGVRDVHGTFQVPLFLQDTTPFSAMVTDSSGSPMINGNLTWTANFICVMPSTVQVGGPALPTVYGHGLLGSASEVEGGSFSAGVADDLMGCATDWVGMSSSDISNVARNLKDMSTWHTETDHMLQGLVNFQFLGRLINSTAGFVTNPAFQDGSGQPLFQVGHCNFMGYSQGGIMGGAASAVSTEWTKVILGVPGMDYGGLLLDRSVDWNEFASIFDNSYTDPVDQQIVLQSQPIAVGPW